MAGLIVIELSPLLINYMIKSPYLQNFSWHNRAVGIEEQAFILAHLCPGAIMRLKM